MPRALGSLWLLLALSGCEAEKLEHPGDPVPPAQRGECEPGAFRAQELQALGAARHTLSLAWAGWTELAGDDVMLELEVALDAEELAARPGCATYVELPALLTLESSDGRLRLETTGTLAARSPTQARLSAVVAASELEALHEQLTPLLTAGDEDNYRLEVLLSLESVEGTLELGRGESAAACAVAAWPHPRRCPLGVSQASLVEPLRGHDVLNVVAELNALGALPLAWQESETTLTLEAEHTGVAYCLHQAVPDAAGKPSQTVRADVGLRLRVASADQNLDVVIPARATLDIDEDGRRTATTVRAHALAASDSTATFGITAPELPVVELALELLEGDTSTGELRVRRLSPQAGALLAQDVSAACLDTDLLGSFADVANGTW